MVKNTAYKITAFVFTIAKIANVKITTGKTTVV
jgi:hypothetical protein